MVDRTLTAHSAPLPRPFAAPSYALYSSFSPGFQKYLEGLTAVHSAVAQADGARAAGHTVRREPVETVHPVVRVHPVTGWKSVFVNPNHTKRIVGVTKDESDTILKYLYGLVQLNHDLQVRFKWEKNSLAIWDNRSNFHTATFDYGKHRRVGDRVVSLGEKPYFDPTSKSRREALSIKENGY